MPPSKDESAGDWYMNRGQQSVIYLPEIRENFLHKRIKHQRNVADWARYESKVSISERTLRYLEQIDWKFVKIIENFCFRRCSWDIQDHLIVSCDLKFILPIFSELHDLILYCTWWKLVVWSMFMLKKEWEPQLKFCYGGL